MNIIDPVPFLGQRSGLLSLVVTLSERATLLRAAAILERGHALVDERDPDHQGAGEDIGDALCLAPIAIRTLATDGLDVSWLSAFPASPKGE